MSDQTPILEPATNFVVPAELEAQAAKEAAKTAQTTVPDPPKTTEASVEAEVKTEGSDPAIEPVSEADKGKAKEAYIARKAQRKAEEAAAKIEALEKRITDLAAAPKATPVATGAPKRPDPKDYELQRWDPKYEAAVDAWQASYDQFVLDKAQESARTAASDLTKRAQREVEEAGFSSRINDLEKRGVSKYSDFEDSVRNAFEAMPAAPEALRELVSLENAEDVFYHVSQRPELLEKITALTPMAQALEFGKLSAKLAATTKVAEKATKAQPMPSTPRGGNGQFSKDEDARYDRMLKAQRTW